ncbi:hypothetical protein GBAR_LOCUS30101 [Geodia barretti]|uniref:Uncharacterized protein n=1 Tax=Geodia barretti TaxID=519541 RepID=A0AA35TY23_GEOBA|nr:hypothetical protein GBAR_LOCUS30101 [Geodia barretti]
MDRGVGNKTVIPGLCRVHSWNQQVRMSSDC